MLPLALQSLLTKPDHLPLESFQPTWQAGLPIPVQFNYDVPVSSLVQIGKIPPKQRPPPNHDKLLGNNYVVRLHPPEESTQTIMDSLDAEQYENQVHVEIKHRGVASERHLLLDSLAKSIDGIVTDLMTPLRALPNPFA